MMAQRTILTLTSWEILLRNESVVTASRLGRQLAQSAIWLGARCNWIGPTAVGGQRDSVLWAHRPLGPNLYDGTSGIAMFLAELARVTGDEVVRKTALGAMRQALESINEANSTPLTDGLYVGRIGIALAAASVAEALGCSKLRAEAGRLARAATMGVNDSWEFDIISGSAGTIIGLLALRGMLDSDEMLLAGAIQAGDRLLAQAACRDDGTIAWYSPGRTEPSPLTGFSHGAAGGGYALFELWAATSETRFRAAAEQSFKYEDSLLDQKSGNWPDLRKQDYQRSRVRSFQTYWCHGAPGIALARLRAYQLTGDTQWRRDAETGLRTTEWIVRACLETGTGNYSLCHGLLGNCEVLAFGDEILGTSKCGLCAGVAAMGAERCAKGYWLDGGTPYATAPSLLTGAAGIGYAYLRAAIRGIRSVLNMSTTDPSRAALPRLTTATTNHSGHIALLLEGPLSDL